MGADVMHVFAELQELKEKGIANEFAQIDFNGTNLVAGIYENVYQFLETHVAVKNGDKEKILSEKLVSKKINCLFYSIKNNYFTYDFSVEIPELQCTETLRIVPYQDYYEEQKAYCCIRTYHGPATQYHRNCRCACTRWQS